MTSRHSSADAAKDTISLLERAEKHHADGELQQAVDILEDLISADPKNDAACRLMTDILLEAGQSVEAIGYAAMAVHADPDEIVNKEKFAGLSQHAVFTRHNPAIEETVMICLKTPELMNVNNLQVIWLRFLKLKSEYKKLYKVANVSGRAAFNAKAFERAQDYSPLLDDFMIHALRRMTVFDIVFESFVTHVRRFLLDQIEADKPVFEMKDYVKLASAVAIYAWRTDYVLDVTEEEHKKVATLHLKLENAGDDLAEYPDACAVLAAYQPLHLLDNADAVVDAFEDIAPLAEVIRHQVTDHRLLRDLRDDITPVTSIEDEVSLKTQAQYEENPYPRWRTYVKTIYDEGCEGYLRGAGADILVAGCGTGKDATELAIVFPDANVLAIDLSGASLSYAVKQAQDLGVKNIEFHQGDILKLGELNRQFDFIHSGGVLHHMADPVAGWKVLTDILKPGKVMRIALYSAIALKPHKDVQKIIAAEGYGRTEEDMREFRRRAPELLDKALYDNITRYSDYYNLSEYRDMLFHVQEHEFTVPELRDIMDELGLEFMKFQVPDTVMEEFQKMFPDDPEGATLENWHAFEERNPRTFKSMYLFWCRKKG